MTDTQTHKERYQLARQAYQQGDMLTAETRLKALVEDFPAIEEYRIALANFLSSQHRAEEAAALYRRSTPSDAFQRGHFLSLANKASQAINEFEQAIHLGFEDRSFILNKIANLYRESMLNDDAAEATYLTALELEPGYSPVLINLANLYEDRGERSKATQTLQQISSDDSLYPLAMTRLAAMNRSPEMLNALESCFKTQRPEHDVQCDMLYELGHQNEAQGRFSEAWQAFQAANQLNASIQAPYTASQWENKLQQCVSGQRTAPALEDIPTQQKLVFICGMFRSGSTLLEQMLAAHPGCNAGGELTLFPKMAANLSQEALQEELSHYTSHLKSVAKDNQWVSDKRPDNLWHVDLIKQVFPEALIIITQRQLADNALSIYQQRLSPAMDYACHPKHIASYAAHCDQLCEHWKKCYPEDVIFVSYENLVNQPQQELCKVLGKMGLEWSEQCLEFHQLKNTVKTASVWQVRQPLHSQSLQRSKHYPEFLKQLGLKG